MKGLLLQEGIKNGWVKETSLTKKLALGGDTEIYPVYRIRLDKLYFNDKNDRIATWIAKYMSDNKLTSFDLSDFNAYNEIIHQFIVESNEKAIKNTIKNIKVVGQQEPGVVLSDGRIIDGNRRFTCLRELSSEDRRYNWFETVILDRDIEDKDTEKDIKLLELQIQHGKEGRIEYDPIDRLVGLYRDVCENQLFTVKEYADGINKSVSDVKKDLKAAELMVEFLEFIKASKQYHIARELKLEGPLKEIIPILNKGESEEEVHQIKMAIFTNMAMKPDGDMTRFIRDIKKVLPTDFKDKFLEEQLDSAGQFLDMIEEYEQVSTSILNENIRTNEELKEKLNDSMTLAVERVKREETLNQPLKLLMTSFTNLDSIDLRMLEKIDESELVRLVNQVQNIDRKLIELKTKLEELV